MLSGGGKAKERGERKCDCGVSHIWPLLLTVPYFLPPWLNDYMLVWLSIITYVQTLSFSWRGFWKYGKLPYPPVIDSHAWESHTVIRVSLDDFYEEFHLEFWISLGLILRCCCRRCCWISLGEVVDSTGQLTRRSSSTLLCWGGIHTTPRTRRGTWGRGYLQYDRWLP